MERQRSDRAVKRRVEQMVRARFATLCWQMRLSNAGFKVDSARHGPFTPLRSTRRCLESKLTLGTDYRNLTGAQLRDKPMLNPREFGTQDDLQHEPSCLHPRLASGTMVLPLAPIRACHDAKPRAGDGMRHDPPESRARSNVLLTRAWRRGSGAAAKRLSGQASG